MRSDKGQKALKGQSIKNVRTKSTTLPCPNWLKPLPPCPCGHTINFEKPEVFGTKKYGRLHLKNPLSPCPHWTNHPSPLTVDVFYGRPLRNLRISLIMEQE